MAQSGIYFFIGTEAELIKLFPVMLQLQAQQVPYHIIASGQNDIVKSTILRALNGGHVDLELSKESDIKKSAAGLMQWFAATWHKGIRPFLRISAEIPCAALRWSYTVIPFPPLWVRTWQSTSACVWPM